ncbi:MAG: rhodanese-like domain-containing protein [Acidimicrobiia bacterium]|nr:rhodanese-like domain-containing protein [Acidimicrobiia bacterium]
MTRTVAEMVHEAKTNIENLTPEAALNEQRSGSVFIDIREPQEVQTGTIAGAHHAPRGMLEFYADPQSPYHQAFLDPSRRTVLYCASGGRSALAAQALHQMGYKNVAHVDGGVRAWQEAGFPLAATTA